MPSARNTSTWRRHLKKSWQKHRHVWIGILAVILVLLAVWVAYAVHESTLSNKSTTATGGGSGLSSSITLPPESPIPSVLAGGSNINFNGSTGGTLQFIGGYYLVINAATNFTAQLTQTVSAATPFTILSNGHVLDVSAMRYVCRTELPNYALPVDSVALSTAPFLCSQPAQFFYTVPQLNTVLPSGKSNASFAPIQFKALVSLNNAMYIGTLDTTTGVSPMLKYSPYSQSPLLLDAHSQTIVSVPTPSGTSKYEVGYTLQVIPFAGNVLSTFTQLTSPTIPTLGSGQYCTAGTSIVSTGSSATGLVCAIVKNGVQFGNRYLCCASAYALLCAQCTLWVLDANGAVLWHSTIFTDTYTTVASCQIVGADVLLLSAGNVSFWNSTQASDLNLFLYNSCA